MTDRIRIAPLFLAAAFLAALLTPTPPASAGSSTITAHQLSISLKAVSQLSGDSGNDKPDKTGINQNDLYNACTFSPATKTQGIFVFFDCLGPPPETATILAIDTQPLTFKATVGTMVFGEPIVLTTAKTVLKSIKVPVTVNINCSITNTTATLNGILNLDYAAFPNNGPVCPISGSLKLTGPGAATGIDAIFDDGSSIKINKRSGGINTIPGPPT